jgi:bacteriorhodopsin
MGQLVCRYCTGPPVNWLRYAGWLVTTPIIIIHMQSLSGRVGTSHHAILQPKHGSIDDSR